jgi:hypothetical protein
MVIEMNRFAVASGACGRASRENCQEIGSFHAWQKDQRNPVTRSRQEKCVLAPVLAPSSPRSGLWADSGYAAAPEIMARP